MRFELVLTEDAENDVELANDWYETKQKGLGDRFLLSVRNCIKLIVKNPFAFAKIYFDIRRANTKKYPYSIFYSVDETKNFITVFAVFHNSREDKKWKERIDT